MNLNHNCVRDLLIYTEENLSYGYNLSVNDLELNGYTSEELIYSAYKLFEAGFLSGRNAKTIGSSVPQILISSITWNGHQFLDNIRDDGVWKDTKKVLSRFSSTSLGIINSVAGQVISSLVHKQLDL